MKKSPKKMVCALLAGCTSFVLLLALTACGGGAAQSSGAPEQGEPAQGDPAASGESAKISVLTGMAYGTEELGAVFEAFKAANPGVEIDVQHTPNDYNQAIASRINSGDMPDILQLQTGSHVEKHAEFAYDFTDDPVVSKFQESAIEISKNAEGRLISLPWTYESMAFIINTDVFEQAGITEMPKTITELEAVCQKLQDAGFTPFSVGFKDTWVIGHIVSHFIATEGADPKEFVAKIDSGELTFAGMKDLKNLFPMLDLMVKYGPSKPLEVDWEISENDLANSKAGIIHMGDWCEATLKEFNPDSNFAFMPVPVSNDGAEPTFLSSISWQFLLHKDSASLEQSKTLLEFMLTSGEGIEWMTKGVKAIPSVKTDVVPDGILANAAKEYVDSEKSLPWNHTLWPANYNNVIGGELQRYIMGEAVSDEMITRMQDLWER